MKNALWMLTMLFVYGVAVKAAVSEGENLLINGAFDAEQVEFPEFWTPSSAKSVIYLRTGGPGGKPAIALRGDGDSPVTVSARQQGLTLAPGETYRVSAWIRTKRFKCRQGGVIVHNSGWVAGTGLQGLPADSDWKFHERTFKLMPSKGNEYGVALFASGLAGEIMFADVKLEAVSEGARKDSSSQLARVAAPRLVPVQPLLHKIPRSIPKLTFKLFGRLADKLENYECVAKVAGRGERQTCPVRGGMVEVNLDGLACGDYRLEAVLRHAKTGQEVLQAGWPVSIIDVPAIDAGKLRRLNMLVCELLDLPLDKAGQRVEISFVNPREGWVFIAVEGVKAAADLRVTVDGKDVKLSARENMEAFRELARGEHRIAVSGAGGGRLLMRAIPEIFNYPPCSNSFVKENGNYDWEFMKRHILPAVTTLNGGQLPGGALEEAKAMGLKWLANFSATSAEAPEKLRARMEKAAGLNAPYYDGITSDELFFGRTNIDNYTRAVREAANPQNRLIYTWIVGKPGIPALHTDFMSACLNASRGRGRLLFEAYCHPQADEKAAAAYLEDMLVETMRRFGAFYPNAVEGTGMIFGNFNQIPIICLESNPEVDFKYFLDMQVNTIANRPEFKDLATTGYWGSYYADEELLRWSFKLMRHYAVEGNKEMLSVRYGFAYRPGFVANPDFAEGLKGWSAAAAAEGAISAQVIPDYGKNVQRRWGAGAAGDTVCVMKRQAGGPSRISQTARGLSVGKVYSLQFVTGDLNDINGKKYNPRRYGIEGEVEGAEVIADRSFVHIDRRKEHRSTPAGYLGKINLHRIVFRAKSPEVRISFNDEKAVAGEELVLNYVQLKPYLE